VITAIQSLFSPPHNMMSQIDVECQKLQISKNKKEIYATIQKITSENIKKIISAIEKQQINSSKWEFLQKQIEAEKDESLDVLKEYVNVILDHTKKPMIELSHIEMYSPVKSPRPLKQTNSIQLPGPLNLTNLVKPASPKEVTQSLPITEPTPIIKPKGFSVTDPFSDLVYDFSPKNWASISMYIGGKNTFYRRAYRNRSRTPMIYILKNTKVLYLLFTPESSYKHIIGRGGEKTIYAGLRIDFEKEPPTVEKVATFVTYRRLEFDIYSRFEKIPGFPTTHAFFTFQNTKERREVIQLYYPLGNLSQVIKSCKMSTIDKISVIYQILIALQSLSTLRNGDNPGFYHRDLKAANVLVKEATSEESDWHHGKITVALSDFGFICPINNKDRFRFMTTTWACSPELAYEYLENSTYFAEAIKARVSNSKSPHSIMFPDSRKSLNSTYPYLDMWSLGCLVYYIYYNHYPIWCTNSLDTLTNLHGMHKVHRISKKDNFLFSHGGKEALSLPIYNLLNGTLRLNPIKRLTIDNALSLVKNHLEEEVGLKTKDLEEVKMISR
jgi:Protein kinase domain